MVSFTPNTSSARSKGCSSTCGNNRSRACSAVMPFSPHAARQPADHSAPPTLPPVARPARVQLHPRPRRPRSTRPVPASATAHLANPSPATHVQQPAGRRQTQCFTPRVHGQRQRYRRQQRQASATRHRRARHSQLDLDRLRRTRRPWLAPPAVTHHAPTPPPYAADH